MSQQSLRIISGENIDVIEPFPKSHLKRVWGWMRRFKSLTLGDNVPKGRREFTEWLTQIAPSLRTYGIVDRDDTLNKGQPTLVGIIFYEPSTPTNGYAHIATSRQAFGKKFADEAASLVIDDLFGAPHPASSKLLRISATPPEDNWMAKKLLQRVGFSEEGTIHDLYSYKGKPITCTLYGITRSTWECQQPHLVSEEVSSEPSETEEVVSKPLTPIEPPPETDPLKTLPKEQKIQSSQDSENSSLVDSLVD